MTEKVLALVREIGDDGNLLVGFIDGRDPDTVVDRTEGADVGDLVNVKIDIMGDGQAVNVFKKEGGNKGTQ